MSHLIIKKPCLIWKLLYNHFIPCFVLRFWWNLHLSFHHGDIELRNLTVLSIAICPEMKNPVNNQPNGKLLSQFHYFLSCRTAHWVALWWWIKRYLHVYHTNYKRYIVEKDINGASTPIRQQKDDHQFLFFVASSSEFLDPLLDTQGFDFCHFYWDGYFLWFRVYG